MLELLERDRKRLTYPKNQRLAYSGKTSVQETKQALIVDGPCSARVSVASYFLYIKKFRIALTGTALATRSRNCLSLVRTGVRGRGFLLPRTEKLIWGMLSADPLVRQYWALDSICYRMIPLAHAVSVRPISFRTACIRRSKWSCCQQALLWIQDFWLDSRQSLTFLEIRRF